MDYKVIYKEKFTNLCEDVRRHFSTAPKCHDWDHTRRVLHNALAIAKEEGGNLDVIKVAAVMHDYARPEEMESRGKLCHAQIGAELVREVLPQFGFDDPSFIDAVYHCVLTHRSRNSHIPESIEAKILFDADKLDSMGAIGIGRAFHFAGRFSARVHNTEEEALNSEAYSENDSAYREFLVKLKDLHKKLLTKTGRKFGEQRHIYMSDFFNQLNDELFE